MLALIIVCFVMLILNFGSYSSQAVFSYVLRSNKSLLCAIIHMNCHTQISFFFVHVIGYLLDGWWVGDGYFKNQLKARVYQERVHTCYTLAQIDVKC